MIEVGGCKRCVLDYTVPELFLDDNGVCQYCNIYDNLDQLYPISQEGDSTLNDLLQKIKKSRKRNYDCIIGVSGGVDSTYTLWLAKKLGLAPLAVHCDTGWNTGIAVKNVKNICDKLEVDLATNVLNWEEFKDIQRSFIYASTPDADIPADIAILATLFKVAKKEGVTYILNGHSFRTEGISPIGWTYYDGHYVRKVHKMFGKVKMRGYPNFTIKDYIYYVNLSRIKMVQFLNYFDYSKDAAKELLLNDLDWKDTGGHHHENVFTHFFQSYYLPVKFNIDKRKTKLSAQILSNQIDREKALEILNENVYPFDQEIVDFAIEKLDFEKKEFDEIMKATTKSFRDYPSYFNLITKFWFIIEFLFKMGFIHKLIYVKYKTLIDLR